MHKKHDTPQTERRTSTRDRRASDQATEAAMVIREDTAAAREQLTLARENIMEQRNNAARMREQAVYQRENIASALEKTVQESDAIKRTLESHVSKLRQANEQLIISTVQAHIMSEEMQRTRDSMGHMAHHDFLTGLPNRLALMERITHCIAAAKRQRKGLAVLFLDLDRFKIINDSLGHATGDVVLKLVADRLVAAIRTTDIASRQGGDEFVVVLTDIDCENTVRDIAEEICKIIATPYNLSGHIGHLGVTIGISMYPEGGTDGETLVRNADVAMYQAKHNHRGCYNFFHSEMNSNSINRQKTEAALHVALEQRQFELHYQPKVNLNTGVITGAEALLRWNHPELGTIEPVSFIPIAEDCGLIVPIGRWVLQETCAQVKRWSDAGLSIGSVAVNISAVEFTRPDFVAQLQSIIATTGIEPSCLELEITEGVLMRDAPVSTLILLELKKMGVLLAVDDFGTGYSSLSYLKEFPIDVLKIDQSFVRDIGKPTDKGIIVDAIIAMGHSLGQRVIAEGIEEEEQLIFLRERNCDEGQGYFLSKPLIADDFAELLNKTGGGRRPLIIE